MRPHPADTSVGVEPRTRSSIVSGAETSGQRDPAVHDDGLTVDVSGGVADQPDLVVPARCPGRWLRAAQQGTGRTVAN